jgi:flagellar biosynthesis/type III secretory pathway protein FliH
VSRAVKGGGARVIDGAVYDAKNEAARIVADAHAEAEQIAEQARELGRAEGRAEVAGMLVRARAQLERRIAEAERELMALAVRIAGRILRRDIALAPESVVEIAKAALDDAQGRHDFVLRAHPDDVALLEAESPGLLARLSVSAHLLIRADDTIERGGCVVESELGVVDARLETQLEAIERALRETS